MPFRPERRYDTDGCLYTKAEFIQEYGGTWEWDEAQEELQQPSEGPLSSFEQSLDQDLVRVHSETYTNSVPDEHMQYSQ